MITFFKKGVKKYPAGFPLQAVVHRGMTPEFLPVGDLALRVAFGSAISPRINAQVQRFCRNLASEPVRGVTEWVPGYAVVTVYYHPWIIAYDGLCDALEKRFRQRSKALDLEMRLVQVPVCYGGEWGPDLGEVAALHEITEVQVIQRHTAPDYQVYFLGFLPGFPYLGGLPPELATPRRATPRLRIPAGSVGIAGAQTGVYPLETPGGWQIIGRTPLRLYDPARRPPALLAAGDRVRFLSITERQFQEAVHETD